MREVIDTLGIEVGDVLMVRRQYRVPNTDPPRYSPWRYFGIVTGLVNTWRVKIYIVGKDTPRPTYVGLQAHDIDAWLLDPDEWPEGVLVTRTKLILLGELEF